MPDLLNINEELGIIEIHSFGEITIKEAAQSMKDCVRISKEKNIDKVLVDASSLTKIPGIVDIFQFFSDFPKELTIALVIPQDSFTKDTFSFGENVAVNRGKNVKLFFDLNDAKEWLKSKNSD